MTEDNVADDGSAEFSLRLYVAGQTPKSLAAITNLKKICEENLAGRYRIEVIDLVETPQLAAGDQIVAIPTLVRRLPPPLKRMIGDLSNSEKVIVGLDLRPVGKCNVTDTYSVIGQNSEQLRAEDRSDLRELLDGNVVRNKFSKNSHGTVNIVSIV